MRIWFYVIVGLQLLFLVGQATKAEIGLGRGQMVTLRVVPVDPRSLFMGRYMNLAYDISTINLAAVPHREAVEAFGTGRTVYVGLTRGKPWAAPRWVTISRPPPTGDLVYLRGRIRSYFGSAIRVDYGIERYFIPETKEQEANRLRRGPRGRRREITVEVSVQDDGSGLIRRVLVDGEPIGF
jgi:uncharacterized membrane-anchored protein